MNEQDRIGRVVELGRGIDGSRDARGAGLCWSSSGGGGRDGEDGRAGVVEMTSFRVSPSRAVRRRPPFIVHLRNLTPLNRRYYLPLYHQRHHQCRRRRRRRRLLHPHLHHHRCRLRQGCCCCCCCRR